MNLIFKHGFTFVGGNRRVRLPSRDTKEIAAPSFRAGRENSDWKIVSNFEEPLEVGAQAAGSTLYVLS